MPLFVKSDGEETKFSRVARKQKNGSVGMVRGI